MSNFTFFHNVFYSICILKSFNSHISVVVCRFFEFGTVSKCCIREWVKTSFWLYFGDQSANPCFPEGYFPIKRAEFHSSFGSVADLRTGGRWFGPRLGQYSSGGLMVVTATRFILLSPLSVASTMVQWESSQWLGKNIVRSNG